MKKIITPILVALIMIIGILAILNPGRRQAYQLFDKVEGKLTHNYFIFSVYQQYDSYTVTEQGKYRVYRRYIGIAMGYYEISPLRIKQE